MPTTAENQRRPSKNPNIPHPGRIYYNGQWRTPEQVDKCRETQRRKMARRRQRPEYVARENAAARDRMRIARKEGLLKPRKGRGIRTSRIGFQGLRWKPKPQELRDAAPTDEIMALVEESLREDKNRFGAGYARGLGKTLSLDELVFAGDDKGDWHDVLADPNHWREPGYEAVECEA